ncbi:MAG TPA: response regulator [Blastocatellia bacterium]|nr:response regulator [Blastocatellia bacterium]
MLPVNSAISIVDDDDSLRNSLNNLLRSLGFRADGFSSAEAFLTSSRLHETDCLILDVRDTRDERTESSASPRVGQFAIPIVFITSHADDEARERALQAGAVAFLYKPCRRTDAA